MASLISDRQIDEPRPLRVIYIGAGVSGIIAAIEFLESVPSLELVIYEKNPEVGGTWYENKYPGCACDIPSHSYQLSYESWTEWSQFYAGSSEILQYWKLVADKYDIRKHIRFHHKCTEARWDEVECRWTVKLLRTDLEEHQTVEDNADVLITGTGLLNEWRWPSITGLKDFKGSLLHTANWDDSFDPTDKRVAVIGAGSSGIQVVPALVNKVKAMDHYVRGKTWISPQLSEDVLTQNTVAGMSNFDYTPEQKAAWKQDPEAYLAYRKSLEARLQGMFEVTKRGSLRHEHARKTYEANMRERLKTRPDILDNLLPDFPPLCKRLTPGPGYLEALTAEHVTVIPRTVVKVDETSVITDDGVRRPVDAIICATGFETAPGSGFPIYGEDGINLRTKQAHRPKTYLGLCTNNFPNFFQSLGPNSFQGAGSLLIMMEHLHKYMAKILRKMAYGNIKTIQPKRKQVENFTRYCEQYFKSTVYLDDCKSWYKISEPGTKPVDKRRERVTALWPGSSLHAVKVLQEVRWEDFDMETVDENEFGWFGNGSTIADFETSGNTEALMWYLDTPQFLHEPVGKMPSTATIEREMVRNEPVEEGELSQETNGCTHVQDAEQDNPVTTPTMQADETGIAAQDKIKDSKDSPFEAQPAVDSRTAETMTSSQTLAVLSIMRSGINEPSCNNFLQLNDGGQRTDDGIRSM